MATRSDRLDYRRLRDCDHNVRSTKSCLSLCLLARTSGRRRVAAHKAGTTLLALGATQVARLNGAYWPDVSQMRAPLDDFRWLIAKAGRVGTIALLRFCAASNFNSLAEPETSRPKSSRPNRFVYATASALCRLPSRIRFLSLSRSVSLNWPSKRLCFCTSTCSGCIPAEALLSRLGGATMRITPRNKSPTRPSATGHSSFYMSDCLSILFSYLAVERLEPVWQNKEAFFAPKTGPHLGGQFFRFRSRRDKDKR